MPKKCFVISPISSEGSKTRDRSDQVLDHVIRPAVEPFDYVVIRADEISEPGLISRQVIQHLIEDELVVADMTGHNPNVFYELGIRHAAELPVVHLISDTERIPFDVAELRVIKFNDQSLKSAMRAKEEIAKQVRAVESLKCRVDNPVTMTRDLLQVQEHREISIRTFLSKDDPKAIRKVSNALQVLSEVLGITITDDPPAERSSFFKKILAITREKMTKIEIEKELNTLRKALELKTIGIQSTEIAKEQANAISLLINSLRDTPEAVVQIGPILIIKKGEKMLVQSLSLDELRSIENDPEIIKHPDKVLDILSGAKDVSRKAPQT